MIENSVTNILLITGKKSFISSGAKLFLSKIIKKYKVVIVSDFSANPKIKDLIKIRKKINWNLIDCVIGIGGGSVIDMSKLLMFYKDSINIDLSKNSFISNIPLVAIPTTAGSGSEATHFSVIYDNDNLKHSVANQNLLPALTILNYNLSYNLSPYMKAVSGLDAFAQAIESYWSVQANEESRKYSLQALELIYNNLKKSVQENDLDAHKMMVKGSNLAGKAINIAKTTACHALSYYFTSNFGIAHGHAVSLTLGRVYEFNYNKAHNLSDAKALKIFENLNYILKINNSPYDSLNNFICNLGIEIDLQKLNIKIDYNQLFKNVNLERMKNNIFPLKKQDIKNIIL